MSDFDAVLAELLEQVEQGHAEGAEAVIAAHPEHADELRMFFENRQWFAGSQDVPPLDLSGRTFGDYVLEEEVARGGMGVVYRAKQNRLDRTVALKVIHGGWFAGEESRRRFRQEAAAAAALSHPGIVPIYEVGHHEGHDYLTMPLIEGGETLGDWVARAPLEAKVAAKVVIEIATSIQHAHQRGVIHRDLKPENVLVDPDGRFFITDFGLARRADHNGTMTRTGQIIGTPYYMSPQQATGLMTVDHRTDVYSLAAILYALCSGQPPHGGESDYPSEDVNAAEVLRRVIQDDPSPLRIVARGTPVALEQICRRGLDRDPQRRYATAQSLAEDLERFLAGEPVEASDHSWFQSLVDEIERDHHQIEFVSWSGVLWQLGMIIFAAHLIIFLFSVFGVTAPTQDGVWNEIAFWFPRGFMLLAVAARIWFAREGWMKPRRVAERPIWSIWMGYLAALAAFHGLIAMNIIDRQVLFPVSCVLSGFGFIAMSGHIWGASGLIGIVFMALVLPCVFSPTLAPLLFGCTWLFSLLLLAHHYHPPDWGWGTLGKKLSQGELKPKVD